MGKSRGRRRNSVGGLAGRPGPMNFWSGCRKGWIQSWGREPTTYPEARSRGSALPGRWCRSRRSLIFDDSTSAVDTATEQKIRTALGKTDRRNQDYHRPAYHLRDPYRSDRDPGGRKNSRGGNPPGTAGAGSHLSGDLCFPDERRRGLWQRGSIAGRNLRT